MSERVEYTERSWNPCTGCTKISEGCRHCYAEGIALEQQERGIKAYKDGFQLTCHEDRLEKPFHRNIPSEYFVNSMSDIYHENVPDKFLNDIFWVMEHTLRHRYYVLTKRPKRMTESASELKWTHNIWCGVTVENKETLWRVDELRKVPCIRNFVSVEPLLKDLGPLNLNGIDWVLCGGESGIGARPLKADWVRSVRDQCITQKVPFLFKQWGGENKYKTGRKLDGKIWDESPLVPSEEEIEEFYRRNDK